MRALFSIKAVVKIPRYCLWDGETKLSHSHLDIFSIENRDRYDKIKWGTADYLNEIEDDETKVWEMLIALASPTTNYFYGNLDELVITTGLDHSSVKNILYDLRDQDKINILSLNRSKGFSPSIEVFDVE